MMTITMKVTEISLKRGGVRELILRKENIGPDTVLFLCEPEERQFDLDDEVAVTLTMISKGK